MRVRVLKAVSMPASLFFAPIGPAMGNVAVHFLIFTSVSGFTGQPPNPLIVFASAVIIHGLLAMWGFKEPHLTTVIPAWGKGQKPNRNLSPVKGKNKYVA